MPVVVRTVFLGLAVRAAEDVRQLGAVWHAQLVARIGCADMAEAIEEGVLRARSGEGSVKKERVGNEMIRGCMNFFRRRCGIEISELFAAGREGLLEIFV